MQLHVVPILLGDGTRLVDDPGLRRFDVTKTGAIDTPAAVHLRLALRDVAIRR